MSTDDKTSHLSYSGLPHIQILKEQVYILLLHCTYFILRHSGLVSKQHLLTHTILVFSTKSDSDSLPILFPSLFLTTNCFHSDTALLCLAEQTTCCIVYYLGDKSSALQRNKISCLKSHTFCCFVSFCRVVSFKFISEFYPLLFIRHIWLVTG